MTDWLAPRWSALVVPAALDGLVIGALVLALVPIARRVSPLLALGLSLVALLKFVMPPVVSWPLAVIDRVAGVPAAAAALLPREHAAVVALAAVHLAGVVIAGVRLQRRRAAVKALVAEGVPVTAGPALVALDAAARSLGTRHLPALRTVQGLEQPMAAGVRRPVILVPSRLADDPALAGALAPVLSHELAHHRHRDLAIEYFVALVTALWWWHPVVHALAATVRDLREERVDDAVVAAGTISAHDYCQALVLVAASRTAWPAAFMTGSSGELTARVRRILSSPRRPRRLEAVVVVPLVLAFAMAALPNARTRDDHRAGDGASGEVRVRQVQITEKMRR